MPKRKKQRKYIPITWKRKKRKLKILLVLIFFVIVVTGFFVIRNKWFAIGEVDAKKIIPEFYNQPLEVSLGKNKLTVTPLAGNSVKMIQKDVRYIYENAYKNTDVVQTNYPYRIKEELIFSAPGHPLQFKYKLGNAESFIIEKDDKGNIIFYDRQKYATDKELSRIFTILTPFIEDKNRRSFEDVEGVVEGGILTITINPDWMEKASYPVILDPTIEINVLNVYSHPSQGEDWIIEFVTKGRADLKIIPQDQATIDDDEFIGLYCDQNIYEPIILAGDVIYYQNWECNGVGKVIHKTIKAGHHTLKFEFSGVEGYAEDWAYNEPSGDTKTGTVEFFIGQYSGNGTTGQNSNTNQTFSGFTFKLAESQVDIKSAYIVFEAQFGAYADPAAYTGWSMAFDVCEGAACGPDAWGSGGGQVNVTDSTTLAYNGPESMGVRLLMDVTGETTISNYTGSGTILSGQVGYNLTTSSAVNSIAQAHAKLVLTYTYIDTSNSYTQTVVYPLEWNDGSAQGTKYSSQASNCTKGAPTGTCPLFNYNTYLGETGFTKLSQWFQADFFNDGNSTTDVQQNVNVQGTDTDSSTYRLEAANGGGQGNGFQTWFSEVSGFSEKTDQQLEIYHSAGTIYLIGGEVIETYMASSSEAVKTKTVRYPIGHIAPGGDTSKYTTSVTVYLPEDGATIKKAWFRVVSSWDGAAATISLTTQVGNNTETGARSYAFDAPSSVPFGSFLIYHVIPSADYAELQQATANSGKLVTVSTQANNASVRGSSAELLITYTYTSEDRGYISTNTIMAGQEVVAPNQSGSFSGVDPVLPETNGEKIIRGAFLYNTQLQSDSDGTPSGTGPTTAGTDMQTDVCSASYVHQLNFDAINSYNFWYRDITPSMNNLDSQTYNVCFATDGDGDSDSMGAKNNAILVYTYQVDLIKEIRIKGNTRIKGGTRLNLEDSQQKL